MIANPTPITAGTFSGFWITSVHLAPAGPGILIARMLPYDGTAHLLAVGAKDVRMLNLPHAMSSDSALSAVVSNVCSTMQRLASKTASVLSVDVSAPDPSKTVIAVARFSDNTAHVVGDCFALCATDAEFASVFSAAMAKIASLAGLSMTS